MKSKSKSKSRVADEDITNVEHLKMKDEKKSQKKKKHKPAKDEETHSNND